MREIENAKTLLLMAEKDLKGLRNNLDPDTFDEELFGFHVQQAVEKALKAWISIIGLKYPLLHDLAELLVILKKSGQDIERYWSLVEYSSFAVEFRYEPWDSADDTPIDRQRVVEETTHLLDQVRELVDAV